MSLKHYEVRCTATAEIVELWRVKARSERHAIELVESGDAEFVEQCSCDDEQDRRDWCADEVTPLLYAELVALPTPGAIPAVVMDDYRALAAGLRELIEAGRLGAGDLPDDFEWLEVKLIYLAAHDPCDGETLENLRARYPAQGGALRKD